MATYYLDTVGSPCPQPLSLTQEKVAQLQPGDILIVDLSTGHPTKNVLAWVNKQGYTYELEEKDNHIWTIKIVRN